MFGSSSRKKAEWRAPHIETYLDFDEFYRARHLRSLDRFKARQSTARRFIALREIALHCVRSGPKIMATVYREVVEMIRSGALCDARGRSLVLYLDPEPWSLWAFPAKHRLSAALVEGAIGHHGVYFDGDFAPGAPAVEYLECAWLRREDARRLLEQWTVAWPARFEPEDPSRARVKVPRGRRPVKRARVEAAMAEDIAAGRMTLEGLRALDGKNLAQQYRVSRHTAVDAREAVLRGKTTCPK